jgi:hypothetical protein
MSTLKSCAECGKPVSSAASRCPHCGSNPSFISCDCCKRDLKRSEAIVFSGKSTLSFHSYCFQDRFHLNFKCPTCNFYYSFSDFGLSGINKEFYQYPTKGVPKIEVGYVHTCTSCGQPMYFEGCNYCGLPMDSNNIAKVKVSYPDSDYPSITCSITFRVHPECKSRVPSSISSVSCFIATAACGEDSLEVQTLRAFRDRYLLSHPIGHLFVQVYQKLSPPLASAIQNKPLFKLIAKILIVNPAFQVAKFFVKSKSNLD